MERTGELMELVGSMPRGVKVEEIRETEAGLERTPGYVVACGEATARILGTVRVTARKLERLSALVRRASLFDDATEEISNLIHAVNGEITTASQQMRSTRSTIGRPNDRSTAAQHCAAMEEATQAEIEDASRVFKAVLQRRRETMRKHDERKTELGKARAEKLPTRHRPPVFDDDAPPQQETQPSQRQQQQLVPDQTYYSSRASATADIEAQVQEIGAIMTKVADLVTLQEEQVTLIDQHAEETAHNVQAAHSILMDRLKNMSDATTTALKVCGIVGATAVIYTIFLA